MQRRERHQLAQIVENVAGHDRGPCVARAAMHDAMADAEHVGRAGTGRATSSRAHRAQRAGRPPPPQRLVGDRCSALVLRHESRRRADAFDLTARAQAPRFIRGSLVDAELEARRAGIQHQRVVAHSFRCRVRRACAPSIATAQLAIFDRTLSARLVRMIGTFAPRTSPALSELPRKLSSLARMLPASRSGASRMSGSPATSD